MTFAEGFALFGMPLVAIAFGFGIYRFTVWDLERQRRKRERSARS